MCYQETHSRHPPNSNSDHTSSSSATDVRPQLHGDCGGSWWCRCCHHCHRRRCRHCTLQVMYAPRWPHGKAPALNVGDAGIDVCFRGSSHISDYPVRLASELSHTVTILTPGQPVLALTMYHQAPGRIATSVSRHRHALTRKSRDGSRAIGSQGRRLVNGPLGPSRSVGTQLVLQWKAVNGYWLVRPTPYTECSGNRFTDICAWPSMFYDVSVSLGETVLA